MHQLDDDADAADAVARLHADRGAGISGDRYATVTAGPPRNRLKTAFMIQHEIAPSTDAAEKRTGRERVEPNDRRPGGRRPSLFTPRISRRTRAGSRCREIMTERRSDRFNGLIQIGAIAVTMNGASPRKVHRTFPGLRMPFGSKTFFSSAISFRYRSPIIAARYFRLSFPMPCSAETVPPSEDDFVKDGVDLFPALQEGACRRRPAG